MKKQSSSHIDLVFDATRIHPVVHDFFSCVFSISFQVTNTPLELDEKLYSSFFETILFLLWVKQHVKDPVPEHRQC